MDHFLEETEEMAPEYMNDSFERDDEEEVDNLMREIFGDAGGHEEMEDQDRGNEEENIGDDENNLWNDTSVNNEEMDLLKERRFIVGERSLRDLVKRISCEQCDGKIVASSVQEGESIAAGIKFTYKCVNGHPGKWISTSFYGGRSFISMLLQLIIILSGATYEHFALGAKFMNLAIGGASHFYRMQRQYKIAIEKYFQTHMEEIRRTLGGLPVSVAVDVRYDTPGFCANRSTAVFLDLEKKLILHMEVGDAREVDRRSTRMEKVLIERGLHFLVFQSPIIVWEVTSDASKTVISILKSEPFQHLHHSLDVWHKTKKLVSTLLDLAKRASYKDLMPWIRPIVNHFWWCCSSAKGKTDKLLKRWMGILFHINNKHIWPGGRCHHSEVFAPPVDAKWLPKDSLAYKEFRKIVTNREWCGSLKYYTNCRQTWAIENFFSHTLLHYCPKQNSFSYDSYHIRNMLAILDHNNHVGRTVRVREDGEPYAQAQVSRRTKQWVAYEKKCPKEYKYIPDLIVACMRETYGKPLSNYMKSEKELSLRSSQPNLSGTQNPGSKFLLACMESRKKQV
nr:uncharacterized protein LOC109618740 isoform X1 [Crassostrea gigas]